MKHRIIFFALVAFLSVSTLSAQRGAIRIGVEGAGTFRSLYGSGLSSSGSLNGIGFYSGLTFQYGLTDKWSLVTGLGFERKGWSDRLIVTDELGNELGERAGFKSNFDYAVLPVHAKFNFGKNGRFFAMAGPYLAYLAKGETVLKKSPMNPEIRTDFTNTVNRFDLGISAGAGASFQLGNKAELQLSVRDNLGLLNVSKNNNLGSVMHHSLGAWVGLVCKI